MIRSNIALNNYNLEDIDKKISQLERLLSLNIKQLVEELERLRQIIKGLIKEEFFKQIQNLTEGFIFPM
jgi:hypothetical protein